MPKYKFIAPNHKKPGPKVFRKGVEFEFDNIEQAKGFAKAMVYFFGNSWTPYCITKRGGHKK